MSREIKFRAWDKEKQKMLTTEPYSGAHRLMTWDGLVYENGVLQDVILMQYTGLKDKNGKEIYEGDIIREWFLGEPLEWSMWKVNYEKAIFGYRPLKPKSHHVDDRRFHPFLEDCEDFGPEDNEVGFEVIGNIYETPEKVKA